MTQLWLCAQVRSKEPEDWDFQGIFSTEELAIAACRDATYIIGPVLLDQVLPHETIPWLGRYYPKADIFVTDTDARSRP
jgi:hypothetical protein